MRRIGAATDKIGRLVRRATDNMRALMDPDVPVIAYYSYEPNWGDALNPVLVEHLSGRAPVRADTLFHIGVSRPVYSVIGSILGNFTWGNLEVWGSGFIAENRQFLVPPRRIHAVRGPLTRDLAIRQGVECPEVYGDPALLYPRFYTPRVKQEYEIGLVPHAQDRDSAWVRSMRETGSVFVLDVYLDVRSFVEAVCRCRFIASSSLHGLIAADAYGIPFTWLELSERVMGRGFKFRDYFASTGRERVEPLQVKPCTTISEVLDAGVHPGPDIDLERLFAACPFRQPS